MRKVLLRQPPRAQLQEEKVISFMRWPQFKMTMSDCSLRLAIIRFESLVQFLHLHIDAVVGYEPAFQPMVHSIIRCLRAWCFRIRSCYVRDSPQPRWPGSCCMGMVHWVNNGFIYISVRYISHIFKSETSLIFKLHSFRTRFRLPNCWWHVLCDQKRRPS